MNMDILTFVAGTMSSVIFVSSNIPMLWKVFKTKDMHSYSSFNLVLVNAGNLIYWVYVASLPFGPIYILHSFYTLASALMLILFLNLRSRETAGGHSLAQKIREVVLVHRFR